MGKVYDALTKAQRESGRVKPVSDAGGKALTLGELASQVKAQTPEPATAVKRDEFLMQLDPHLIMHRDADPAAIEQFKVLRTQIYHNRPNPPASLMVASSEGGEGKTMVAANLAISLALGLNERAVLVDCDLRQPGIHRLFGLTDCRGLADYLLRDEPLEGLIVQTPLPRLMLLPSGACLHRNAPELLSCEKMHGVAAEVARLYPGHFIICDSPPIAAGPDAAIIARYLDAVLLVVRSGAASREVVARAMNLLGREKILGAVFNGAVRGKSTYQLHAA